MRNIRKGLNTALKKNPLNFKVTTITCMNTSKLTLEQLSDEATPASTPRSFFRAPARPSGPVTVNDAAALLATGAIPSRVFANAMQTYINVYRMLNEKLGFVHTDCKLNNIFTSGTSNDPHFQIADLDKTVVGIGKAALTIGPIDDSYTGALKARRDCVGIIECDKIPKLTKTGLNDPVSMQVDMAYLLGDIFYNSSGNKEYMNETAKVILTELGSSMEVDDARAFYNSRRGYLTGGYMTAHDKFVAARKEL